MTDLLVMFSKIMIYNHNIEKLLILSVNFENNIKIENHEL